MICKKVILVSLYMGIMLFWGCSAQQKPPKNLIAEDTYIDLMVEFQLLKTYQQSLPPDSSMTDSLTGVILEKYDITEDQFLESQKFYQQDYKNQTKQVKNAIERLKLDRVQKDSLTNRDSSKVKKEL